MRLIQLRRGRAIKVALSLLGIVIVVLLFSHSPKAADTIRSAKAFVVSLNFALYKLKTIS